MSDEKIEAFVDRILQECEQEGFTVSEARKVAEILRSRVFDRSVAIVVSAKFTLPAKDE